MFEYEDNEESEREILEEEDTKSDLQRRIDELTDLGIFTPKEKEKDKSKEEKEQEEKEKKSKVREFKDIKKLHTVHRYVRHEKRKDFFRCADKYCYHLMDKASLVGKASLCNACKQEFELTREDLKRKRPLCFRCSGSAKAARKRELVKQTEELFKEIQKDIEEQGEKSA